MKKIRNISLVVCLFALSSIALLAKTDDAHTKVKLDSKTKIGNLTLKPDTYTLKWNDTSSTPRVQVMRNNKEVGTVPAKLIKHDRKGPESLQFNTANRTQSLDRVYLKHETIVFGTGS